MLLVPEQPAAGEDEREEHMICIRCFKDTRDTQKVCLNKSRGSPGELISFWEGELCHECAAVIGSMIATVIYKKLLITDIEK